MVSTTVFIRYVSTAFGVMLVVMLVLGQCAAVLGDLQPHEGHVDDAKPLHQKHPPLGGGANDNGAAGVGLGGGGVGGADIGDADDVGDVDDDGGLDDGGIKADVDVDGDSLHAPLDANQNNNNNNDRNDAAAAGGHAGGHRRANSDDGDRVEIVNNAAGAAVGDSPPQHHGAAGHDGSALSASSSSSTSSKPSQRSDSAYANLGFVHGFLASLSVILVSELGDKTFFIAAIMAMRHSRVIVFVGAIGALGLMTVLSVVFGMAATIIPRVYTYYISTVLFAIFGLKMLSDGWKMSPTDAQEELEEVQMDLKKREEEELEKETVGGGGGGGGGGVDGEVVPGSATLVEDPESGGVPTNVNNRRLKSGGGGFISCLQSRVLMQAFTMTFVAEWGDRSQLTTIILGAREDAYGVIVGGVLGHMMCTGLAVIGGRMIAQRISVRTVTLVGGVVFLVFALSSLFMSPEEELPTNV